MLLTLGDLSELIKITATLGASFFALYLPLRALTGRSALGLKLAPVLSISVQILFGYLFYSFYKLSAYPLYYLGFVLIINALAIYKIKPKLSIERPKIKLNLSLALGGALIVALAYNLFFDSVSTYAPGAIDTINHIIYLFRDLKTLEYLSFPTYPPGFHILMYPLTLISSEIPVYRFTGPLVGLVIFTNILIICKDLFKTKILLLLLFAVLLFPIFNQLTLQMIGFFPTALSFLFIAFTFFLFFDKESSVKLKLLLSLIVMTAMGLTIPYLTVQLVPSAFILLIFSFFFFKKNSQQVHKSILIFFLTVLFGFAVGFFHVYLQGSILDRTSGFPSIETVSTKDGSVSLKTTYEQNQNFILKLSDRYPKFKSFVESPTGKNYIMPMFFTGYDIVKVKNLRGLDSVLSIGAYLIILFAISVVVFRRKNLNLTIISIFVLLFGVSTQIGIFEISTYRGRSGFCLLFFGAILIVGLINEFYRSKYRKHLILVSAIMIFCSLLLPPKYYRDYYREYYDGTNQILSESSDQTIHIITSQSQLAFISRKISTEGLRSEVELDVCNHDRCFLILEKNYFYLDPILSQRAYATEAGVAEFNAWQQKHAKEQIELTNFLKDKLQALELPVYLESENLMIYQIDS